MSWLDRQIDQMKATLDTWESFAKPYTDEKVLKDFGTVTVDGDEIQITNHAMQSVVKFIKEVEDAQKKWEKQMDDSRWRIRNLERDLKKAKEFASLSDPRLGDALDKHIDYLEQHSGEEDLVWGPVDLLSYCRDRLRNRT